MVSSRSMNSRGNIPIARMRWCRPGSEKRWIAASRPANGLRCDGAAGGQQCPSHSMPFHADRKTDAEAVARGSWGRHVNPAILPKLPAPFVQPIGPETPNERPDPSPPPPPNSAPRLVNAVARLWQMDALRPRTLGGYAECLGPSALPMDMLARRLGLTECC